MRRRVVLSLVPSLVLGGCLSDSSSDRHPEAIRITNDRTFQVSLTLHLFRMNRNPKEGGSNRTYFQNTEPINTSEHKVTVEASSTTETQVFQEEGRYFITFTTGDAEPTYDSGWWHAVYQNDAGEVAGDQFGLILKKTGSTPGPLMVTRNHELLEYALTAYGYNASTDTIYISQNPGRYMGRPTQWLSPRLSRAKNDFRVLNTASPCSTRVLTVSR